MKIKYILWPTLILFGLHGLNTYRYIHRLRHYGTDAEIQVALLNVWNKQILNGNGFLSARSLFDAVQCEMIQIQEGIDNYE